MSRKSKKHLVIEEIFRACQNCDNDDEFITQPNKYEVYKIVNNKLEYQNTEIIGEKINLYCRECSAELVGVSLNESL